MFLKKSLFYRYLLSYLLITAVPLLLLSAVLYNHSVANLKEEIEASSISKLKQVKNLVDQRLSELGHIAFRISQDNRLSKLQLAKGEFEAIEAVEELRKYKANSVLIEYIFFNYRGEDTLYSSAGKFSQESFHTYFYKNEEWDRTQFLDETNRISFPTVKRLIESKQEGLVPPRVLGYIYPIFTNGTSPSGTIVFTIQESIMSKLIEEVLGEFQGEAYILNEQKQVMAAFRQGSFRSPLEGTKISELTDKQGISSLSFDNETYSLITVRSEASNWLFVTLIPTKQLLSRVSEMRILIAQIVGFVALIGACTALFFASNHYRPFKKWLLLLKNESESSDSLSDRRNELELIGETAYSALTSNRELREKALSQRDWLREQLIMKLLAGKLRDETEYVELSKAAELEFKASSYVVMLLAVHQRQEHWHVLESIHLLLEGLTIPGYTLHYVEAPDEEALAVIVGQGTEIDSRTDLAEVAFTIHNKIKEQILSEPYIGVGQKFSSIGQAHKSYVESAAALEFLRMKESSGICRFGEIAEYRHQELWYPVDEQIRFIQSLKQGNLDIALENLELILQSIASKGTSLLVLRYVCFDMVNSMIKTVQDIHRSEFMEEINNLIIFTSLEQLRIQMEHLTVKVCGYVDGLKASRNSELFGRTLQHVRESFTDPMFSLESVADHIHVTSSYLSKFFKEQMGTTFSDYVTGLRLAVVKRLLIETRKPIKEIVESSGYSDLSSFVRKFKSLEGVTPGQYRKLYQNETADSRQLDS